MAGAMRPSYRYRMTAANTLPMRIPSFVGRLMFADPQILCRAAKALLTFDIMLSSSVLGVPITIDLIPQVHKFVHFFRGRVVDGDWLLISWVYLHDFCLGDVDIKANMNSYILLQMAAILFLSSLYLKQGIDSVYVMVGFISRG